MLFDEHEAALAAVIPSPHAWIERIVHHLVVEDRSGVDKIALVQCNYVLRIVFELCFLKSMALDAENSKAIAYGCTRYRQIKERSFAAVP